jgi:YTH domain-containing family protein
MLRIFHTHPARTSLLQDFAFYEVVSSKKNCLSSNLFFLQLQSMQRMQAHAAATSSQSPPSPQNSSPSPPLQQFNLGAPNNLAFSQLQLQQMNPLMQMQMGLPFVNPQTIQSLMRNPSPVPNPGFAGGVPGFSS